MKKKPSRDPIAAFERGTRASRRVGVGSRCVECGEDRPLALISGASPKICANCQREKWGRSPFDDHHPAGEANDSTTIPIPVNDHRALLSPQQYEWPPKTWVNPESSPIRAGAARVRGYCETSDYLVNSLLIPNAEMLEALDEYLEKRLGPKWWVGTEMERFAPKRKPKRAGGVRVCALSRAAKGKGSESEKNKVNVKPYIKNAGQQERLPLLDVRLFKQLQKKGVVTGRMTSCKQITSPKFKGLAMEFKNGTAKFSFLANFERWDIAAIARQLGSDDTDDWVGQQLRFIMRKGQNGGTFVNVENLKKAPQ